MSINLDICLIYPGKTLLQNVFLELDVKFSLVKSLLFLYITDLSLRYTVNCFNML